MMGRSPLQDLSFDEHVNVSKGIVKATFNTHLQNLNDSLSKIKGLIKVS